MKKVERSEGGLTSGPSRSPANSWWKERKRGMRGRCREEVLWRRRDGLKRWIGGGNGLRKMESYQHMSCHGVEKWPYLLLSQDRASSIASARRVASSASRESCVTPPATASYFCCARAWFSCAEVSSWVGAKGLGS